MDAIRNLNDFKSKIDIKLKKYLFKKANEAKKTSKIAEELMNHISDLTLRSGKRIRASLLYYSYLAHGGTKKEEALKASMAMELSETYLLIHDDIMDDDLFRRGGITIHNAYRQDFENNFPEKANPRNFGNSMGILAGDIACALSNELLCEVNFEDKLKNKAICELNKVYSIEGYGQAMDIISGIKNNLDKDNLLKIHQLKTVPYTFDGPIKIGAMLAGADDKTIMQLSRYTVPLGTAFQIQDDILGMFGSEEKLGKPVTSDLKEGKKTLLIIHALEKATPEQKEIILFNLGNKRITTADLIKVRDIVKQTGSLKKSKDLARSLVKEAINELKKIKLQTEGKKYLLGIAEYMINREY